MLLVFLCLAWYVTNNEAKTSGVKGSIVDKEDLIENVEYYKISNKNEASGVITYTFGEIDNTPNGKIEMGAYNPLSSTVYPQRLMVITLKKQYRINMNAISSASDYLGNVELKKENNSLTSIIGFYYLPTITTDSNGKPLNTSIDTSEEKLVFADTEKNVISKSVTLIERSALTDKLYVLIDYYEESIEHIYSLNIGNDVLNPDGSGDEGDEHKDDIKYICDFYFTLKEAMAL